MAAIEWKRREPADDLLSALIAAEEEGDRLSTVEPDQQQVVLVFIAGHETTAEPHRERHARAVAPPRPARQLLQQEPDLIGNAVEGAAPLRHAGAVHAP